jgi:glycosyltransferase involved in cell wall biosynthesis
MRLAWFSPLPPHRSGIAAYSADILSRLAPHHEIEAFVDDGPGGFGAAGTFPLPGVTVRNAHLFPPSAAVHPHDLTVYQVGNHICHHYMWAHLVHYPGLVVLHDAQLHQARARALIQQFRPDDYLAEFEYSHPEANPDVAQLVLDGLGCSLYYLWPMIRIPVEAARLVGVHNTWLVRELTEMCPGANVVRIRQGVPDVSALSRVSPADIRRRHGIPEDAVVVGSFGRVTPEKSLTRVLSALAQVAADVPALHLLVVGDTPDYFDLRQLAQDMGLGDRVAITGYVDDDALPDYLTAVDVCLNLRWPTSRETSGAWIRCLAAGKPTVITDLAHLTDVPSLDLRSGKVLCSTFPTPEPVCVAVDLLDEPHMLRLALRRLGTDAALRARLGASARQFWQREATMDVMTRDYEAALAMAAAMPPPAPRPAWPAHLREDGSTTGRQILSQFDLAWPDLLRARTNGMARDVKVRR